ncbi:hypothetical protein SteCoe_36775 [Stentor coeruleus]|uniref:Uncharacterized protein n=1 Tax=Stentor coeruleus TaxID=5963 RepID=A0A1R2APR5_9CILI|nr:hypothetical protein SteCoe_36775 [Stentor coeruleus]
MEDRLTCASDLDCSRGSDFNYAKDIKGCMSNDIENIKKTYQKRKNIMRNYSMILNMNKRCIGVNIEETGVRNRPEVMVKDTPVEKFLPKTRPKIDDEMLDYQ